MASYEIRLKRSVDKDLRWLSSCKVAGVLSASDKPDFSETE